MGDEKTGPSEVGLGKHRRPHVTTWWEELSMRGTEIEEGSLGVGGWGGQAS